MYVAIIHKDRVLEIAQSDQEYANGVRAYAKLGYEGLRVLQTNVEAFKAFSNGFELAPRVRITDGKQDNYLKIVK